MESTIDISEVRKTDPETLRAALLDQLAYLIDEIQALQTVVGAVPEQIKSGRPAPDALTMKELYGVLAVLDSEVRRPRIDRMIDEEEPTFESVDADERVRDGGWNEKSIADILDRVVETRQALIGRLEEIPVEAWHRSATLDGEPMTLFKLVYEMTQADANRLRDLGYRLHNAHLSERDKPLPT